MTSPFEATGHRRPSLRTTYVQTRFGDSEWPSGPGETLGATLMSSNGNAIPFGFPSSEPSTR